MVWENVNTAVGCIRKGKPGEIVALLMCFEIYTQVSEKLILRIVLGENRILRANPNHCHC
jgi:hypothetical protein